MLISCMSLNCSYLFTHIENKITDKKNIKITSKNNMLKTYQQTEQTYNNSNIFSYIKGVVK